MAELAIIFLGEEFYWIPSYIGLYAISRSAKIINLRDLSKPKLLSQSAVSTGYIQVGLRNTENVWKTLLLHRLMATTFLGLDLSDRSTWVDHIDSIKAHNQIDNLRIGTASQNKLWQHNVGDKDSNTHKQCRKCMEVKLHSEFCKNSSSRDNLNKYCKSCTSEIGKQVYLSLKEKCK